MLTIDASFTKIRWVVGQDDDDENIFVLTFGANILNSCQHACAQVKRELWRVVTAMKNDKEYLVGATMVVETYCLPLLEMIVGCPTPDIAMLKWTTFIN